MSSQDGKADAAPGIGEIMRFSNFRKRLVGTLPQNDMTPHLRTFFAELTDEELLIRIQRGLTDEALAIARCELARRNLELPAGPATTGSDAYLGDMVILERDLMPTEAQMLCSCLRTVGIQADTSDVNFVQTQSLLAIAVGGAKVVVPEAQLADAREVLQAFRRGDFELDDDFDVGEARS